MIRRCRALVFGFVSVAAFAGCGEIMEAKGPWGEPTPTMVSTLAANDFSGQAVTLTVRSDQTVTVNGKTYSVTQVGRDPTGATSDFKAFVNIEGDTVTFGGGEVWWPAEADYPFVSGTTNEPVTVSLDPPLNVDQTAPIKGSVYMGDPANPSNYIAIDTVGTFRAVEKDTSVQTAAGVFSGVTKFTGEIEFEGTVVNGVAWYHPEFGMIKGTLDWPSPNGSVIDLAGVLDLGTDSPGTNVIRSRGVVSDANPTWELNTYDVGTGWSADRSKHAKMLLEMRFVDETSAKNASLQPNVNVEFGTTMGYFPHLLAPSPVSLFHPEDNDKGYTFWVAYVDQAGAKWDHTDENYHITVTNNYGNPSPVQVTGRIIYQKYDPAGN